MKFPRIFSALLLGLALLCQASALAYVGNLNSHKFHEDHCRWVRRMNEENKVYIENRTDAIRQGYIPCKVCRP